MPIGERILNTIAAFSYISTSTTFYFLKLYYSYSNSCCSVTSLKVMKTQSLNCMSG